MISHGLVVSGQRSDRAHPRTQRWLYLYAPLPIQQADKARTNVGGVGHSRWHMDGAIDGEASNGLVSFENVAGAGRLSKTAIASLLSVPLGNLLLSHLWSCEDGGLWVHFFLYGKWHFPLTSFILVFRNHNFQPHLVAFLPEWSKGVDLRSTGHNRPRGFEPRRMQSTFCCPRVSFGSVRRLSFIFWFISEVNLTSG